MPVVADTGPILAAINRRDEAHELASELLGAAGRDLLVPEPVIAEVDYLARVRIGRDQARRFLDALVAGAHTRVPLSPSMFADAVAIDRRYADLDLGIVDASVMAVASATASPILTFDFTDFRAAPPLGGDAWELVIDEAEFARATRSR